jgi:hypothetical protein
MAAEERAEGRRGWRWEEEMEPPGRGNVVGLQFLPDSAPVHLICACIGE